MCSLLVNFIFVVDISTGFQASAEHVFRNILVSVQEIMKLNKERSDQKEKSEIEVAHQEGTHIVGFD